MGVRIPAGTRDLSLLQNVQTGFGAHRATYSIFTAESFPGGRRGREKGLTLVRWSPTRGPTACIMRAAAIFVNYVYSIKIT
jgi:hypothetical protein